MAQQDVPQQQVQQMDPQQLLEMEQRVAALEALVPQVRPSRRSCEPVTA